MNRWLAAAVLAAALVLAGWLGWRHWRPVDQAPPRVQAIPLADGGDMATVAGVETVAASAAPLPTGGTPMAQRVVVVGLLNKRNGVSRELTLKPGQATRIGDAIVRVSACEKTAPWEAEPLTGAFVQLDVRGPEGRWGRSFSGWLYKERPGLNVVQHPVYDVWTKSCAMSWPETGADTDELAAPKPPRSSASKRPSPSPRVAEPESAAPSNAI